MSKLQTFIESNQPFAVIRYHEYFRFSGDSMNTIYEIIYLDDSVLKGIKLKGEDLDYFKENQSLFKISASNKSGVVYELNGFKNHYNDVKSKMKINESEFFKK